MIVTVINKDGQTEKYSFPDGQVLIGRNPSSENSVLVDSQTISRNHLIVRTYQNQLQIKDLNSSKNIINSQRLMPNEWVNITAKNQIKLAQFQGYVQIQEREAQVVKPKNKKLKAKEESQSDPDRQRSREKQRQLPFKLSQSTLKMVKEMTVGKKSKEERIKFLKLMGIGKAEEYWQDIEALIKNKKASFNTKKTNEDIQRQFTQSRNSFEKKGLGRF